MRYYEIASGLRLPVSFEEQVIIDKAANSLEADELDERSREVARLMVNRGLLNRLRNSDGKICFKVNSAKDIWRDR